VKGLLGILLAIAVGALLAYLAAKGTDAAGITNGH
jgi:hypothetical protein